MKNYYTILGVDESCTDEELRSCYRKLAMRYHPDRNPDDLEAEERFKEIAEAYGVLTDPVKRREYDLCRKNSQTFASSEEKSDFAYSQEDILKDLFQDPMFQQMFRSLLSEFQRAGFRYSSTFVSRSFFGAKGGMIAGGIFFIGSLAGPLLKDAAKKKLPEPRTVIDKLGVQFDRLLGREEKNKPLAAPADYDVIYHTPLTGAELKKGRNLNIFVHGPRGEQTLKVKIPPGSRDGQKLRLRGKGRPGPQGRGDLYLRLEEKG